MSSVLRSRGFLVCSLVVLLLGAIVFVLLPKSVPFDEKEFHSTTRPSLAINAPLRAKINRALEGILPPKVRTWTFPPSASATCDVSGLLNQCMEVTGTRYLIHKDIARAIVDFGHTNVLSGPQWVGAIENALQTGTPEWHDKQAKKVKKENLVLIRFTNLNTVLVVPQDKAAQFQSGK